MMMRRRQQLPTQQGGFHGAPAPPTEPRRPTLHSLVAWLATLAVVAVVGVVAWRSRSAVPSNLAPFDAKRQLARLAAVKDMGGQLHACFSAVGDRVWWSGFGDDDTMEVVKQALHDEVRGGVCLPSSSQGDPRDDKWSAITAPRYRLLARACHDQCYAPSLWRRLERHDTTRRRCLTRHVVAQQQRRHKHVDDMSFECASLAALMLDENGSPVCGMTRSDAEALFRKLCADCFVTDYRNELPEVAQPPLRMPSTTFRLPRFHNAVMPAMFVRVRTLYGRLRIASSNAAFDTVDRFQWTSTAVSDVTRPLWSDTHVLRIALPDTDTRTTPIDVVVEIEDDDGDTFAHIEAELLPMHSFVCLVGHRWRVPVQCKQTAPVDAERPLPDNARQLYSVEEHKIAGDNDVDWLARYPPTHSHKPDVVLATQSTASGFKAMEMALSMWDGPVAAVVYVRDASVIPSLRHSVLSSRPGTFIQLYVARDPLEPYPVNKMRNLAIDVAQQHLNDHGQTFLLQLDADFAPSEGAYDRLRARVLAQQDSERRQALVVPCFEIGESSYDMSFWEPSSRLELPRNKQDLRILFDRDLMRASKARTSPDGHGPTDYSRWFDATQPYTIAQDALTRDYEPYYVARFFGAKGRRRHRHRKQRGKPSDVAPRFDERYRGWGGNAVSQTQAMRARGFEFTVVPDVFVVHLPHARRSGSLHHIGDKQRNRAMFLFDYHG
eukprot:TRINITY_DN66285_c7_g2_i1.p1 TRINITY_DN66285_c7_g2~~TRINITY_DN66285_c7_g2_i1.p1  ORF type:complete len:737 (-),score=293.77 TRINITY_DN66285_c7_g2_i1:118-2274(-)